MAHKIDVHTHAIPDFYQEHMKPLREHGGWTYIPWSVDATKSMAAKLGVKVSILSLSAPGPELLKDKDGARACARQYNDVAAQLVKEEPASFGFFASVPNAVSDTEACLAEMKYAFDTLGADGVTLHTQYAN
jgi:6-methylsalicylate decarboxylase